MLFFFRFDTKIGIEHQSLLFFSSLKVVRSLSLARSLSRRSLAVLFLFSKSRLDLFLRAVRLSLIVVVWGLLKGIGAKKGGVVFCRPARRRRRRRLHSARTSVPRRRAEVLRIERGFAFGACALPRFAARARASGGSKKDLVLFRCVSLFFTLGVTFFLSLINRREDICTREKELVLY